MWIRILFAILIGYLLGNINGAICISKLVANEDVRNRGSGNAGLTNYIRNYGTHPCTWIGNLATEVYGSILLPGWRKRMEIYRPI